MLGCPRIWRSRTAGPRVQIEGNFLRAGSGQEQSPPLQDFVLGCARNSSCWNFRCCDYLLRRFGGWADIWSTSRCQPIESFPFRLEARFPRLLNALETGHDAAFGSRVVRNRHGELHYGASKSSQREEPWSRSRNLFEIFRLRTLLQKRLECTGKFARNWKSKVTPSGTTIFGLALMRWLPSGLGGHCLSEQKTLRIHVQ